MKKHFLLAALGLSLAACQKDEMDIVPATVESRFDRDFTLAYRQQVKLPSASQPELTITVTDIQSTFCPENFACLVGTTATPVLHVKDTQGQTQQVLPARGKLPYNVNAGGWIDTISVRANGRRYLLYYVKWRLDANRSQQDRANKDDFTVTLRVKKFD